MKTLFAYAISSLLLATPCATAGGNIHQERIRLETGASTITITGKIKGYQTVDYRVQAKAGQSLVATFRPDKLSAYFNVLPPGSDEAMFVGSSSGSQFEARLAVTGEYTIRVYLMRNAARRNESAKYTLNITTTDEKRAAGTALKAPSVAGAPFDGVLELQGIRFNVTSTNEGSVNTLRIVAAGLEIDNSPIVRTIDGTVTGAEVADLNGDGSPEIYVYVTSAGSGSYASLVAYAANRRKSLSEIYLPPLSESGDVVKGYMGHDEFAVLEGALGRRFPVYRDSDINATPTRGMRQLEYKLVPGEAGWVLKIDKVIEY